MNKKLFISLAPLLAIAAFAVMPAAAQAVVPRVFENGTELEKGNEAAESKRSVGLGDITRLRRILGCGAR
jgi:hypothetical protein